MKVAVFIGYDEIIILAVKGQKKDITAIDGYDGYFGQDSGRDIDEYDVNLCHIGSSEGLRIRASLRSDCSGSEIDIHDWF